MSETTTTERGATVPGAEARTSQPPATTGAAPLAIRQDGWTENQTAVLRAMGLEHADEADLKLFHHYAARTGLDPFTRQVYMVGRDTEVTVREVNPETGNARDVKRRVTKFTIQVGIDGWRVLGNRAAHRDGVRVGHKAPLYAGKDGTWSSIWVSDQAPVACQYTLLADGVEVTAICYYAEYVQYSGRGEVTSMWKKMPLNQLAKCAEALAWRKAFPADFAGLVLEDAAQAEVIDGQVIEADAPTAAPPKRARGAERVRERAKAATREEPQVAPDAESERRAKLIGDVDELLKLGQVDKFADMAIIVAELGGLDQAPANADEVSTDTLSVVVDKLADLAESGDTRPFGEVLDDVFNRWLTRHPDDETQS